MPKFFHKIKRHNDGQRGHHAPTTKGDLMDPILYNGGLDPEKYPLLVPKTNEKPVEEPENPLNKR